MWSKIELGMKHFVPGCLKLSVYHHRCHTFPFSHTSHQLPHSPASIVWLVPYLLHDLPVLARLLFCTSSSSRPFRQGGGAGILAVLPMSGQLLEEESPCSCQDRKRMSSVCQLVSEGAVQEGTALMIYDDPAQSASCPSLLYT